MEHLEHLCNMNKSTFAFELSKDEVKEYILEHKAEISPVINREIRVTIMIDEEIQKFHECRFPCLLAAMFHFFRDSTHDSDDPSMAEFLLKEFPHVDVNAFCVNSYIFDLYVNPVVFCFDNAKAECCFMLARQPEFNIEYLLRSVCLYEQLDIRHQEIFENVLAIADPKKFTPSSFERDDPKAIHNDIVKRYIKDPHAVHLEFKRNLDLHPCAEKK